MAGRCYSFFVALCTVNCISSVSGKECYDGSYYSCPQPGQNSLFNECCSSETTHCCALNTDTLAGIAVSGVVAVLIIAILVSLLVACCCPCCRYTLRIDLKKSGFNKLVCMDKKQLQHEVLDLEESEPQTE